MASFSQFYDHIAPFVIGADTPIIDFHIRRVAREFLRRTCVWREQVQPFDLTIGQPAYVMASANADAEVCNIMSVVIDGEPLPVVQAKARPAYGQNSELRKPRGWSKLTPRVLRFSDSPDKAYTCHVEVALSMALSEAVQTLPDFMLTDYNDVFTAGVLASMMMTPGKPWTNLEGGTMHNQRYKVGLLATRAEYDDGGKINLHQFRGPRFGA